MNKLSNILWKIFTSMVVFSCHTNMDVNAEESPEYDYAQTQVLCRSGYYVSKCGEHTVGTNWLKGYRESENTVSINASTQQSAQVIVTRAATLTPLISGVRNSPNYYDYSGANNIKNLRSFFSVFLHDEDGPKIIYTTSSGTLQIVSYSEYKNVRDSLLSAICNPIQHQIVCSKCPGVASVPASTVDITYDSGLLVPGSWKFHTIADCYMQEFQDSTGIFEYVDDDNTPQNCYYSNEVAGDVLIDETAAPPSIYDQE